MSPIHEQARRRSPASLLIEAAGGSSKGVATRLGVTHGTVSRYLSGTHRPHPRLRAAIAAETDEETAAAAIGLIAERIE